MRKMTTQILVIKGNKNKKYKNWGRKEKCVRRKLGSLFHLIPVMFYRSNYLNSILHNEVTSLKKEKGLPLQTLNILPMTHRIFSQQLYITSLSPQNRETQNFKCFLSPQKSYKCFTLKFLLFTLARSSISELKFVSPSIISSSSNVRSSSKS